MLRQVDWHRVRVGLAVALIIIFAGVVIDSLFSASWALDDGLSWRRPQSSRGGKPNARAAQRDPARTI